MVIPAGASRAITEGLSCFRSSSCDTTGITQPVLDVAHGVSEKEARRGRYRLGEGVTGSVIQTGEMQVISKISESPLFHTAGWPL